MKNENPSAPVEAPAPRKGWQWIPASWKYHAAAGSANVWPNGTWHTFDADGVGGENSSEGTVERAMEEAEDAIVRQGWDKEEEGAPVEPPAAGAVDLEAIEARFNVHGDLQDAPSGHRVVAKLCAEIRRLRSLTPPSPAPADLEKALTAYENAACDFERYGKGWDWRVKMAAARANVLAEARRLAAPASPPPVSQADCPICTKYGMGACQIEGFQKRYREEATPDPREGAGDGRQG